jgi:hypothetical protein
MLFTEDENEEPLTVLDVRSEAAASEGFGLTDEPGSERYADEGESGAGTFGEQEDTGETDPGTFTGSDGEATFGGMGAKAARENGPWAGEAGSRRQGWWTGSSVWESKDHSG